MAATTSTTATETSPTPPAGSRPRLFLIDGYSNIFRAFYAIRNLSNSRGEPTNAVYGFVTMLRKLLREENPELIGVALEGDAPSAARNSRTTRPTAPPCPRTSRASSPGSARC
jgi:hypothetical protein